MKRHSNVAYSAFLLVVFPFALARAQGVSSSAHDFTTATGTAPYNFATGLCETCHTPHGGATGLAAPLWNHTLTSASGFTLYTSPTFAGRGGTTITQPDGVSRLCLSCHDGTIAVDAYGGAAGTLALRIPAGDPHNLTQDLSNDHPVSFDYNAALVALDPGLQAPVSASQATAELPLYAAKLQCGTCHNPHGTTNPDFLRHAAATICTECHIK